MSTDTQRLRRLAGGGVLLAGDEGYDRARTTWSLAKDLRPAAVAFPRSVDEVAAVVRAAASTGLRVAPLGTGHNAHPLGDLGGTVLLRMSGLTGITVDPYRRRARAAAGEVWLPVVEAAGRHGLAALHGSSPDTGVVGYSLGGGISWYARSLGLAANSVTAVELVTADGDVVRADADHDADLFWALRGGGGANVGAVTALEFDLHPIETAYAGMLVWDMRDAPRVLHRWAEWSLHAPDAVTSAYRQRRLPPAPELPAPFRGRDLVVVDGAVVADDTEAQRILAPLRDLRPEIDTFGRVPAVTLPRLHMDPDRPTPGGGRSTLLEALPPAAVDQLVGLTGADSGSTLRGVELRQLGGALARAPEGSGAIGRIDGAFLLMAAGLMLGDGARRTIADAQRVVDAFAPWSRHRAHLNFEEEPVDPARGYDPAAWARLVRIRADVDPKGLFQANHEVPVVAGSAPHR